MAGVTVELINHDHGIRAEITAATSYDAWIAGYTPNYLDGHPFYALSPSSMHEIFKAIRGTRSKRPIGFTSPGGSVG